MTAVSPTPIDDTAGIVLSTRNVTKAFGSLVVLDSVSLNLQTHDALGVVGPNGAGKTTLLSILSGAQQPSLGSVQFRNADVTSLAASERCRLGLVRTHQIPQPFLGMTVFENVFVAAANGGGMNTDEANIAALEAIELCGMRKVANRRAESLGLLDRKRLEMARALGVRPSVLLLDEIAGGLTEAEANDLVGMILSLKARKITLVWIEHIVHALLKVATRLICMDAGRIIADGDPAEVMANKAVVSAYLGGGRH